MLIYTYPFVIPSEHPISHLAAESLLAVTITLNYIHIATKTKKSVHRLVQVVSVTGTTKYFRGITESRNYEFWKIFFPD